MRTRVFRFLAGVLAALLIWFLITADHGGRSYRELAGFCGIAVLFAGFGLFGTGPADRFLALLYGFDHPRPQPKDDKPGG